MVVSQQLLVFHGCPTKNDHFGVWNGGTTILGNIHYWWIKHILKQWNHALMICIAEELN